jgi:hypothetical protein
MMGSDASDHDVSTLIVYAVSLSSALGVLLSDPAETLPDRIVFSGPDGSENGERLIGARLAGGQDRRRNSGEMIGRIVEKVQADRGAPHLAIVLGRRLTFLDLFQNGKNPLREVDLVSH